MYGEPDPSMIPLKEDAPVRPLSPYGASKQALEAWLGVYQRTFGLTYTVLRYANIYGPRQGIREEGAVVAVFATRMARDEACIVDGTGQQTRDFIYVSDCVTANLAALDRGDNQSFNIGWGREVSIRQVFDTMKSVTGYAQDATFGPGRTGDVIRIALDASAARDTLGWEPKMPLDQGLKQTYDYFRSLERA